MKNKTVMMKEERDPTRNRYASACQWGHQWYPKQFDYADTRILTLNGSALFITAVNGNPAIAMQEPTIGENKHDLMSNSIR